MKRASVWREVLSLSSQWDPSSSNRRECLYIAVIMGCNGFVNGGNKERNGSLLPGCHLPFSLVSLLRFSSLRERKMRGSETSDQLTTVLDNRRSQLPRVPLPYLHRSSVNREDHLLMFYGHPPTSTATKAVSRPPALVLLTYRFIFCRVEPFTLFFASSLSLPPLPHFLLSHSLFQSPSLPLPL